MTESTSQKFITALEPQRHALYAAAVAAAGARAEALLQGAVRTTFQAYAAGTGAEDIGAGVSREIAAAAQKVTAGGAPTGETAAVMPAAVWARLTAAVQIEAAKIGGGKALNPDSVLLAADPLLVGKPHKPMEDEFEGLGLSGGQRFVLAVVVAVVVGVGLTVVIARHWHGGALPHPAATASTRSA